MLFPYEKNFNQWCSSQNLAPEQLLQLINRSIIFGTIFYKIQIQNLKLVMFLLKISAPLLTT